MEPPPVATGCNCTRVKRAKATSRTLLSHSSNAAGRIGEERRVYSACGFHFARSRDHIETQPPRAMATSWTMNFRRSVDALCPCISWSTMLGRETYCRSRHRWISMQILCSRGGTRISGFRKARQISVSRVGRTNELHSAVPNSRFFFLYLSEGI